MGRTGNSENKIMFIYTLRKNHLKKETKLYESKSSQKETSLTSGRHLRPLLLWKPVLRVTILRIAVLWVVTWRLLRRGVRSWGGWVPGRWGECPTLWGVCTTLWGVCFSLRGVCPATRRHLRRLVVGRRGREVGVDPRVRRRLVRHVHPVTCEKIEGFCLTTLCLHPSSSLFACWQPNNAYQPRFFAIERQSSFCFPCAFSKRHATQAPHCLAKPRSTHWAVHWGTSARARSRT